MLAGSLEIQLRADMARLANDMHSARNTVDGAMSAIEKSVGIAKAAFVGLASGMAGVLSVGMFASWIKGTIDAVDSLNDLTKSTGLTVEQLSGLQWAAQLSGTDLEGVAKGVNKLAVEMGKDEEKFRSIGVTAKDPIEAFKQLSDVFVKIQDPQARAAFGAEALGKQWEGLAPLLAEGGNKIGEMVTKGQKLSGVTEEMAEKAAQYNDQMDEMRKMAGQLGIALASELLPGLNAVTQAMLEGYQQGGKLQGVLMGFERLGAVLFSDEYQDDAVRLDNFTKKLVEAKAKLRDMEGAGVLKQFVYGDIRDFQGEVASIEMEIASLVKSMEDKRKKVAAPVAPPTGLPAGVADFIKAPKEAKARAGKTEAEKAAEAAAKFIEKLKEEEVQIGKTADQIKMMTAAREAAKAPTAKLRLEIMETALSLDLATKAHEAKTEAEKIAAANEAQSVASAQQKIAAEYETVESLQREIETYDMLPAAITRAEIAKLEMLKSTLEANEGTAEEIRLAQTLIDVKKRQAGLQDAKTELDKQKESVAELKKIQDNFVENVQRNLGSGLFDMMNGSFKGIGDSFKKMIVQMIADAAAANLTAALFGNPKQSGSSGLLSEALSGAMSYFGVAGARADGGHVNGGSTYLVGERGPELFKSSSSGNITPNHQLGGSNVRINVINQNGSDVSATQRQTGDGLQIDVLVRQLEGAMAENLAYGTGSLSGVLQSQYGMKRT